MVPCVQQLILEKIHSLVDRAKGLVAQSLEAWNKGWTWHKHVNVILNKQDNHSKCQINTNILHVWWICQFSTPQIFTLHGLRLKSSA